MNELQYSKIIPCPVCMSKLCKIDSGGNINFRHKGSVVIAKEAILKCVRCSRFFLLKNCDFNKDIPVEIEEVKIG